MDPPTADVPLWHADHLCRACYKELNTSSPAEANTRVNILELPGLMDKLSACISNIFITADRGSKYLCWVCFHRVNEFYEFREMCLQSIRRFEEIQFSNNETEYIITFKEESIKSEGASDILLSTDKPVIKEEYELNDQEMVLNRGTASVILPEGAKDLTEKFAESLENDSSEMNQVDDLETAVVSVKNEPISNESEGELSFDDSRDTTSSSNMHDDFHEDVSGEDQHGISSKATYMASKTTRKREKKRYSCDKCQKSFNKERIFNAHIQKHEGLKPWHCTHEGCDKSYSEFRTLRNHLSMHENPNSEHGTKRFHCTHEGCDKSYLQPQYLKIHQRKHNDPNGFKRYHCTHEGCDKSYAWPEDLKKHKIRHENSNKRFHCTQEGCDKSFSCPEYLKKHQRRHNIQNSESYRCSHEGCSKSFPFPSDLRKHQSRHENSSAEYVPKRFYCSFEGCDKSYAWPDDLKKHRIRHENSNKRFHCTHEGCDKSFSWSKGLKRHQISHKKSDPTNIWA